MVDLAAVVVNRVLPELFTRGEEEVFERCASRNGPRRWPGRWAAGRAGARRRRAGRHPAPHPGRAPGHLRSGLPAGLELLYVPELFQRSHGVRATRQIAESLGAELGF